MRGVIARIQRWLTPAAAGSTIDPTSSSAQSPAATGAAVVVGQIEEAEQKGEEPPKPDQTD
jgi:hypothetical protein